MYVLSARAQCVHNSNMATILAFNQIYIKLCLSLLHTLPMEQLQIIIIVCNKKCLNKDLKYKCNHYLLLVCCVTVKVAVQVVQSPPHPHKPLKFLTCVLILRGRVYCNLVVFFQLMNLFFWHITPRSCHSLLIHQLPAKQSVQTEDGTFCVIEIKTGFQIGNISIC